MDYFSKSSMNHQTLQSICTNTQSRTLCQRSSKLHTETVTYTSTQSHAHTVST